MFKLTINGRPIGPVYGYEEEAIQAYLRMKPVIQGVGWTRCD